MRAQIAGDHGAKYKKGVIRMAFQMNVTLDSGIVVTDAYVKIMYVRASIDTVTAYLKAYKDRNSMLDGYPQIEGYAKTVSFTPEIGLNKGDFVTQGYAFMKSQDEFKDATDVLEDGQTA